MSDTKVCSDCAEEKPLSEYYLRKDGPNGPMKHRYNCKVCHSEEEKERRNRPEIKERARVRAKVYYANNKEHAREVQKKWAAANPDKMKAAKDRYDSKQHRVRDYLTKKYEGVPCMDCDGVFAWCAMDFDHRPGEVKEFGIGTISCLVSKPETLARAHKEIAKCDLVCSNCHRVRTKDRHAKPQS